MNLNPDRIDLLDAETYLRVLIAVAKADRSNGAQEEEYIGTRARRLGIELQPLWRSTEKEFTADLPRVSRQTALVLIKDCINLASLDRNYTLFEKSKIYELAERLGIPRSDVERVREWVEANHQLLLKWEQIVQED